MSDWSRRARPSRGVDPRSAEPAAGFVKTVPTPPPCRPDELGDRSRARRGPPPAPLKGSRGLTEPQHSTLSSLHQRPDCQRAFAADTTGRGLLPRKSAPACITSYVAVVRNGSRPIRFLESGRATVVAPCRHRGESHRHHGDEGHITADLRQCQHFLPRTSAIFRFAREYVPSACRSLEEGGGLVVVGQVEGLGWRRRRRRGWSR